MSAESPRHARSGGPLTVPSQPPSDRSLIDAVSGFISDVTLSSTSNVDPKDVIQWARFETADINEPTPEGDSDNDISPLLLILGYGSGVQVWLIPPTGEAQEVLSWRQGTVRVLRILPTPQRGDCFASKRPLIALCDSASPGPTFCSLSFISIKGGEQVKSIKFKNPILDVLANKRSVVVSFSERFAVFDAATLEDRIAITTCYPCPCPLGGNQPINPLALGDRWLAYADKKLNPSKRSSGGCESESVTSYTATVLHAAKSLSKGLRGLGESMAHSLAGARGTSQSPSPPNTDIQQSGVVTVLDIEGNEVDDGPELEEPYDPLVAHFVAHSEAIIAMKFDSSGMLLVTADRRGHDFHVFRLNPHPCGPSLASVHHLYVLHRGDTTAKVQDIAISGDSRWAAISTLRGTTHLFAISPYGGACGVRTHTSPRVVNRLSRFHRSAGLPIHARHSPVNDIVGAGSAWYPNPRLPPYPQPVQAAPLAQLRPTDLPTRTITRTSSGRQRLSSLSEDSNAAPLLARATFGLCAGGTGAGAGGQQRAPVAALYLLAAGGGLSHLALRPRPAANVPKDKICDETPLELQVEPIAQWPLQRGSAADILAPLPPSNPLLQPLSCRRCADMCMNEEERWLSQVEIVTHAGPHRRLWMGPQFVFKTYNCTGSTSSLSEAETVEVDTTSSSVARSNPVNMPSVLPVLIDSGSNSSLEHSPSEHFRRKSLLAETGRAASVCDVQLKEDLAEAMKEEQGWRSESSSAGAGGGGGVARAVDPLGTVVAPPATRAPPALDPDDYTTSNADEATFRPVVRAPAAIPREPDIIVRPLPRNTTIPVQNVSPVGTLSPEDEPLPLNTDVVIPAALTNVPQWKMEPESTEIIAKREVAVEERKNKASPPREEAAVEERKAKVSPPREETIREERKAKVYPPRQQATVEECKAGLSSPREKVTIEKPKEKVSPSREEAIVEERNAGLSHSREKLTIEEPKANVSPPKEEAAAEERKSKASPPKEEATKKIEKKKAIPLDAEKSTKLDKISKQMSEQRKTEIKPDQSTKTKESKVGKSTQQDYNKADKSRGQRDMAAIREKSLRQRDFVAIPDDITKQKKEKEEKSIEDKRSKQTVIENELQENYDEPENPDVETAKKKDRIILDVKKTDVNKDLSRQVIDARKCDIERDRGSAECAERESNDSKSLPKSNRASDDIQPTARTRIKKSPTPKLVSDRDSEDSVKDNKTNNLNDSKLNEPKEVKDNKDIKKQNNNKELKALKEFKVTKDDRSKLSSDENSSIEILEDVKNSDKNLVSISDEPSIAVTLKLPYKPNQAHDTQAKKREDIEIKTEEQAWDMLNEPEKPILNISDQSIDEKPKLKRNRKSKKSQDELQSKADEDSFVEIHAIEENQSCSGDLVSISTPFEELESDSSYLSKTKKPRSPKCLTPEKCDDYERKPTSSFLVEEPFSYSSKLKKKLGDVSSNLVPITEPKAQAYKELVKEPQSPNTLKIKKHIDGTASESSSLIFKDVKPQKSKSLSPYPEGCKIEKPSEQKEIYVINTTEDDFPEIQITRGTKIQRKSPQPENNIFVKETALEKPVKSWSSIAASKNIKKTENILEKKVNDDLKDAAEAIEENLEFAVSFQDKLFELCKRTDIMVAECDTPSDLDFVEEHHNVLHDLPPLEPLDFGLKDFNLEVMRDSLLDVHDPKITSPICKINIDDILFSIKDTTSKVIESSSFNLIDLEKVPAKKEKGFSVIESTKIKSQDIKLHYDTKVEEGEVMEKSSDEDNTSPIVSTDSDKEDKKNGVASNLVLPSAAAAAAAAATANRFEPEPEELSSSSFSSASRASLDPPSSPTPSCSDNLQFPGDSSGSV